MSMEESGVHRTIQTNVIVRKDSGKSKNKKLDYLADFDEVAWCELCERAYIHTLLVDKISEEIKTHPDLINWILQKTNVQSKNSQEDAAEAETKLRKGFLSKSFVRKLYESIKNESPFRGISARLKDSAIDLVEETFKGWLKYRKTLIKKINNKQRHLAVVEQDIELAKISDFNRSEIENKAQQILDKINAEKDLSNDAHELFDALYKQFDSTEDLLERRAIIHLLINSGKVRKLTEKKRRRKKKKRRKQRSKEYKEQKGKKDKRHKNWKRKEYDESSEPMTFEEYLQTKRIGIERLKQQLLSQLPKARNLFPDLQFEESLNNLIALPSLGLEEHDLHVLLTWSLVISQLNADRHFKLQQHLFQTMEPQWERFNRLFYYSILLAPFLLSSASTWKSPKLGLYLIQAIQTRMEQVELLFSSWEDSITTRKNNFLRQPKSLPYPISFGYDSVMSWRTNGAGKIFFKLNGWGDLIFEVRCHHRQLSLIKTFLKDWQTKEQCKDKNKYSGSLMLLRKIELIWKPHKTHKRGSSSLCPECEIFQQYPGQGFWNECDLSIHWTYEATGLTKQGLEIVKQQKLQLQLESLNKKRNELKEKQEILSGLEQKFPEVSREDAQIRKIEELKKATQKLQDDLNKPHPKLECLKNSPLFDRPDYPLYKGIDNIFVGVLLDLEKHIAITIVDAKRRKVLAIRNARSISKEGYKLLQTYFQKRREHSKQRRRDQKAHRHVRRTESGLGEQAARLFAKGIIELAQQYRASTIVIPETKGLRDRLYDQLVARAEIECGGCQKAVASYTKRHGVLLHQWNYSQLSNAIADRAETDGFKIIEQKNVYEENAFQQAANLAIAAYDSLNLIEP